MSFLFDFHDSEVRHVRADGDALLVAFSAAAVRRPAGEGGRAAQAGHVRTLEMRFAAARWSGTPGECIGRLAGGRLWLAGEPCRAILLPWAAPGPVKAELAFGNGALLAIEADSIECRFAGEPDYTESLAC